MSCEIFTVILYEKLINNYAYLTFSKLLNSLYHITRAILNLKIIPANIHAVLEIIEIIYINVCFGGVSDYIYTVI